MMLDFKVDMTDIERKRIERRMMDKTTAVEEAWSENVVETWEFFHLGLKRYTQIPSISCLDFRVYLHTKASLTQVDHYFDIFSHNESMKQDFNPHRRHFTCQKLILYIKSFLLIHRALNTDVVVNCNETGSFMILCRWRICWEKSLNLVLIIISFSSFPQTWKVWPPFTRNCKMSPKNGFAYNL